MMTAYAVTVRVGVGHRYTDSVWIKKESAEERADSLVEEFTREGYGGKVEYNLREGWGAWVSPVQIQDAELGEPTKGKP